MECKLHETKHKENTINVQFKVRFIICYSVIQKLSGTLYQIINLQKELLANSYIKTFQ